MLYWFVLICIIIGAFCLFSELSWPFDIAPNADGIGLHAIQTSTPRNADCVLPPLKTPANHTTPYCQAPLADSCSRPQVWCARSDAAETGRHRQAQFNQIAAQPFQSSGQNDNMNCLSEDTLKPTDLDQENDEQCFYVGDEHLANMDGYGVDVQSGYAVDHAQPTYSSSNGLVQHSNHAFAYGEPEPHGHGQMLSAQNWNQQMFELEQQDVTDVGHLPTADGLNYYSRDGQYAPSDNHNGMNAASQSQWPTATNGLAGPSQHYVGPPSALENNVMSTWPRPNVLVAQSRDRPPTNISHVGDSDFGGYRVQYRQQRTDQSHSVSAAGDGHQQGTVEQANVQPAVVKTVSERLQQAFLQPGK